MKHTHLFQTRAKIDYIKRCIEVFIYKRGVHVLLTSLNGKKSQTVDPETMNFSIQECTPTLTFFLAFESQVFANKLEHRIRKSCVCVCGGGHVAMGNHSGIASVLNFPSINILQFSS